MHCVRQAAKGERYLGVEERGWVIPSSTASSFNTLLLIGSLKVLGLQVEAWQRRQRRELLSKVDCVVSTGCCGDSTFREVWEVYKYVI